MNATSARMHPVRSTVPTPTPGALVHAAHAVAAVAGEHADRVDRDAVFPGEALAAMRERGLLGAMVPAALGGYGMPLDTIAQVCKIIGARCASAGLIYAMHQSQVACVVEHGRDSAWHRALLERIAGEQLLVASATSEQAISGAQRAGGCVLKSTDAGFHLVKMAPTLSYGEQADVVLVTARRSNEASQSDQVMACVLKSQLSLQRFAEWNAMGMRGTCSHGFRLEAQGIRDQILPVSFGEISDMTMTPIAQILWSATWTGIAADAVHRARSFVLGRARSRPGALPPSAARLAEAVALLQMMESRLDGALAKQDVHRDTMSVSALFGMAVDVNGLKTAISTMALEAVQIAMMICGMAGYRQDTPFSLGRHLRDLWSAPLMVNNDRILSSTASLLLADRSI